MVKCIFCKNAVFEAENGVPICEGCFSAVCVVVAKFGRIAGILKVKDHRFVEVEYPLLFRDVGEKREFTLFKECPYVIAVPYDKIHYFGEANEELKKEWLSAVKTLVKTRGEE
jgi:hypothetical protein